MTKYHYCLLLMGSLLLGSCQSVEQLSIDYMLPAEVSFPATLKRVAVVNNMPNVPDNKLIISEEEQKKSENEVARLTNYYNGDWNTRSRHVRRSRGLLPPSAPVSYCQA